VADLAIDLKATASVLSDVSEKHASMLQTAVPRRAVSDAVIAFEPIDVDDENWGRLAFELNRAAEGIDPVQNGLSAESSAIPAKPDTEREADKCEWIDEVCGRLIRDVRSIAMTAQQSSQRGSSTSEALISTAMRDQYEQPTAIAETLVRSDIVSLDASTSVEWSPGYGPDLFAAIENQLAQIETNNAPVGAHEVAGTPLVSHCGQPESSAPVPTAVAAVQNDVQQGNTASSQIPWPVFAPENSVPRPATHIAEEIKVPWPVFASPEQSTDQAIVRESSTPETRWGQAIHLTREALVAWMKVLAGPALVEVRAR
jgi:hypothetical protein